MSVIKDQRLYLESHLDSNLDSKQKSNKSEERLILAAGLTCAKKDTSKSWALPKRSSKSSISQLHFDLYSRSQGFSGPPCRTRGQV